ncbi:MAG: Stk1 family PASTA domain-containing Ser/Thr kinase [Oscillospiraceae bacterium]|mgnify:FL=1|nr:Stk1 family PASTA domain-containing Ser/Thr kinase [Oscillospiraceae bacterium]
MNTNDKYIGRMLDDRYEILEIIGEGGMAVVYKALCHRLNRYVAVKIMRDDMAADEEFRRRFCAESHAVAMLSHPNIVAVYDVSHSDDIEYIVMELVEGITLKQYMEKKGALAWKEVLHFSKQISKALAHAHERGIIHRDIKPQNIMLLRDGTIKVGDFGIAALENEIYENNGQAIGSIHYIAPEQARGECPDARSDIYSLGVVMYEMLTGEQPYTGETLGEIAVKHMNAEPVPPREKAPETPEELERICLRAMNASLEERYQTAGELYEDLEAFTQEQLKAEEEINPPVKPIRAPGEQSKKKYSQGRRRAGRVSFLAGTFGVLVTALALFIFLWNFWLGEIFSPAERIRMPNFVGSNYEALLGDSEIAGTYSFRVTFIVDPEAQPGIVLAQNPGEGRSIMITPDGVEVELTVSAGESTAGVPDVLNMDYRDAAAALRQAGFSVEIQNAISDSVAKDLVISTSPNAGEQLSTGSTVYIVVSSGTEISYVSMPNLVGLSEDAAISQLQNSGLVYGASVRETNDVDAGTVIGQSVEAFTDVEEHSKIVLTVSAGPEG